MPDIPLARAEEIGLSPERLQHVCDLLEQAVRADKIPGAALCVGRKGAGLEPRFFGRQRPDPAAAALRKDALFLVASITKPVTAVAVMMLLERGRLSLEDPVVEWVPTFGRRGKETVLVRHLLTHTSGLPDMLPNDAKLRAAHKPLAAFVEEACELPLLFPPGTKVNYQSTGFALLAEIVHQVTGTALADFLRKEVFEPLGMSDTSLGWRPEKKERIAVIRVGAEREKTDWHWNTPYWLGFGAPWGGLITSPADLAVFCRLMLNGGSLGGVRLLSPAAVRAMTTNQLLGMPLVPEEDRRCRPWGLGWKLQWPSGTENFGDLPGPRAYGHWGATGTLCWIDPDREAFCLLLTTEPHENSHRSLRHVSNAVAAAVS
ncbi:MAG TPA: serine hydrolase domain-containing protein [Gemmataceae bacterium]|nr:serine hydrolase domain-containing protein [Gemmataceae bacterium]